VIQSQAVLGRICKWIGIVAGGLLLVPLLLFAAAWLVNSRADEPLTSLTLTLLHGRSERCTPEDNIYLAIEGFDAPSGESVIAAGQAKIARYNQRIDAVLHDPTPASVARLRAPDAQRLVFTGDITFLHPLDGSVWDEAWLHRQEIERLLADNAELYQRYLALIGLHAYCETARPSELAPFPVTPTEVRKLFLGAIALHLRSTFARERRLALSDLQSDMQLWRVVLTAQGALLWKMLAVAYLESDELLLADLIADGRAELPLGAAGANDLAGQFDLRDFDLGSAFAAEFRIMASVLRQSDDLAPTAWRADGPVHAELHGWLNRAGNRMTGHFFKLNATENLIARQTARQMVAASDPVKFRQAMRAPRGWLPEGKSVWSLPLSYNPVGRVLAAVATPAYDSYPPRAWDAAALQRLVQAGYEIRRRRLKAAEIPAFLREHPEVATHPADGRPFLWDGKAFELSVQTMAQHPPGRRFSIRVWQAPGG
jgi:hypothetical protein